MIENNLRGFRSSGVSQLFKTNMTTINIYPKMKKTNQYLLLAVCTLGVAALSTKLVAADDATPAVPKMACCAGMSGCNMTTPVSDTTNVVPDQLGSCPVSGDKLGEMGKPFTFTYKDQEVKLCCKSCKKDFDKDPDKYIAKIRAADKK